MGRTLSGFTLLLAGHSVYVQAAVEGEVSSPSSETEVIAWILAGVVIFFVMVGYFTWRLVKSERKRQLENKQP